MQDIRNEFGGSGTISLADYYRGGGIVPSNQTKIPASGVIGLSDFYGTASRISVRNIASAIQTTSNADLTIQSPALSDETEMRFSAVMSFESSITLVSGGLSGLYQTNGFAVAPYGETPAGAPDAVWGGFVGTNPRVGLLLQCTHPDLGGSMNPLEGAIGTSVNQSVTAPNPGNASAAGIIISFFGTVRHDSVTPTIVTPPSGMTHLGTVTGGTGANRVALAAYYQFNAAAGAVGTKSITWATYSASFPVSFGATIHYSG